MVRMPALGEVASEGVVRFLKRPGAPVKRDEPVAEVETDKVSIELVAPEDGTIESFAVAEQSVVAIDGPLYVLRVEPAAPTETAFPELGAMTLRWDAGHVQARARGLGEPRAAEAALILTALARALAAVPALLPHDRGLVVSWVDVDPSSARWLCGPLALDVQVAAALAWTRVDQAAEPRDSHSTLRVLRLHHTAVRSARASSHAPLQLVIGPVRDEPTVVSGVVVVRPSATITIESRASSDALLRFADALAEQLTQV